MRVGFAGTPSFAVPSLQRLLESSHEVVCVITQPDRPAGRGLSLRPSPVKHIAEQEGLTVYQPVKFNSRDFLDELEKMRLDLILVAAYGKIFKSRSLALPAAGCVNLHASLLPGYRGVAPINWAVINGETETGVTTFFMEKGVDTGDIIIQKTAAIGENETAGDVHDRLAVIGADAVVETCDLIAAGKAPRVKQDDSLASYAPKLEREDARITWERPAREVHNHIRGVNPRPGAFTIFRDGEVKILDSRLAPDTADAGGPDQRGGAGPGPEATAGGILAIEPENGMLVACSPGAVWLRMLQAAGRKSTDGAAFSRGARLARGDYFG